MQVEVYSARKPASPVRAWASSLGLFVGVTALAWSMATGHLDRHLGVRQTPDGFNLSLRVPKGFGAGEVQPFPSGSVVSYGAGEGPSRLVLSVWRFKNPKDLTASRVCDLVFQAGADSAVHALLIGSGVVRDEQIGGRAGREVENVALAMVVRAVVTDQFAVAVALNGRDPRAVRGAYAAFDLACRSVEFETE